MRDVRVREEEGGMSDAMAIGKCGCGALIRAGETYTKSFIREPVYGRIGDPSGGLTGFTPARVKWRCGACLERDRTP